mgnify:CR=1 FL=1
MTDEHDITKDDESSLLTQLDQLETFERSIVQSLQTTNTAHLHGSISSYNEWRSLRKADLKNVRRNINAILQELATRRRAQRRRTHELGTQKQSPYYHFVELARSQMKPEEFKKAWEYALKKANLKQSPPTQVAKPASTNG